MWLNVVDVLNVLSENPAKLTFVEDEEVIQALSPDTAQEALAHGSGPWGTDGSPEDPDPARCCDASELGSIRAVVVTDQGARPYSERRRFSQLVRDPHIGWMPCDAHMDHCA